MAQFITFYSYKGGVGRTLALANSAWLFANHTMEPAKVLVVDFDLAAPGLHRVLKMPGKTTALGIVDYVTEYLATATVPDISRFIHKTAFPQIDIIPAGKLDARYQTRLDLISWKSVYEQAHGFLLIDALKRSINGLAQDYDYVLIDSLTGFSDVGGICVRQLADSVVLLFRLNQQNLDGIATVYKSLDKTQDLNVTPVITPAWPFLDDAAGAWIDKADKIFAGKQLHEISFDSGLTFGENIIAKNANRLTLKPKVLEDYQRLASHLRAQNPADPLTMWKSLTRASVTPRSPEVRAELELRLLRKRPDKLQYWQILPMALGPISEKLPTSNRVAQSKLRDFLNEQCKSGNKFALLGRASLVYVSNSTEKNKGLSAVSDLTKALEIDAKFFEALEMRAHVYLAQGRESEGLRDLEALYKSLRSDGDRRAQIAGEIGSIYLDKFDAKAALSYLTLAVRDGDKSRSAVRSLAQALYLDGSYEAALSQARRYGPLYAEDDPLSLLPSQVFAAMGKYDDALEELRAVNKRSTGIGNLAEAYLAVDPLQTLELLKRSKDGVRTSVRRMLTAIAHILLGDKKAGETSKVAPIPEGPLSESEWSGFEIVAMVFAKRRSKLISERDAHQILGVLNRHARMPTDITLP